MVSWERGILQPFSEVGVSASNLFPAYRPASRSHQQDGYDFLMMKDEPRDYQSLPTQSKTWRVSY